jgi:drug/metabolite transporter (DMT)-like permease
VLGALFAVLSAASFALNNAVMRRGVVTGSPIQGMAVSVPIGIVCFLPVVIASGEIMRLPQFPPVAVAWMAGVGILHFILGRYSNYRANQAAGVNLTAPVVQLQVVVALVLAVAVLGEPCTLLQAIGGLLIAVGSVITQRQSPRWRAAAGAGRSIGASNLSEPQSSQRPAFVPHYLAGYVFACLAALAYGTTPIMARFALADSGVAAGVLGGLIAYVAASAVVGCALLLAPIRRHVMTIAPENMRWFAYSGVFVAMAQGFFFAAVAIAPILLVTPILQLSLVFRIVFSTWLNRDYELFGPLVIAGTTISVLGSLTVAIDTGVILHALAIPDALAQPLLWRV